MNFLDRLALLPLFVTFVFYPVVARVLLQSTSQRHRTVLFAGFNVFCLPALIVAQTAEDAPLTKSGIRLYLVVVLIFVAVYLVFLLLSYETMRRGARGSEGLAWFAFFFPLSFLCVVKYLPSGLDPLNGLLIELRFKHPSEFLIGLSYMAFRLSHLLREVRNGAAPQPSLAEYLAFALFVPTMTIGPINPYSNMQRSFTVEARGLGELGQAWLRILIGLTKYLFLATILNQLTYSGLLLDGHPHARMDLLIAIPAYTLYLYCNFSGFCDMVIGVSAFLGIEVSENFDRPFAARNLQEFWNTWHITLSAWFRDMMFTPMLKALVRRFGPASMNPMVAVSVFSVFLVLGVWHGVGLNFVIFGALQGVGLVAVHYYKVILKKALSRDLLAAYQKSRVIHFAGTALTFAYFSLTLFFFANSTEAMQRIASAIV